MFVKTISTYFMTDITDKRNSNTYTRYRILLKMTIFSVIKVVTFYM